MATTDIFRTQLPSRLRLAMCRFSSTFPPTKIHSRSLSFSWAQHTTHALNDTLEWLLWHSSSSSARANPLNWPLLVMTIIMI